MAYLSISTIDAKETLTDLINQVSHRKERIILTRRDKEIAALIPIEDLHLIHSTENKNDDVTADTKSLQGRSNTSRSLSKKSMRK